jgi:hypothetical protein
MIAIIFAILGLFTAKTAIDSSISGFATYFHSVGGFSALLAVLAIYLFVTQGGLRNFLSAPAQAQVITFLFFLVIFVGMYTSYDYIKAYKTDIFKKVALEKNKNFNASDLKRANLMVNDPENFELIYNIKRADISLSPLIIHAIKNCKSRASVNKIDGPALSDYKSWGKSHMTSMRAAILTGQIDIATAILKHKQYDPLALRNFGAYQVDVWYALKQFKNPNASEKNFLKEIIKKTQKAHINSSSWARSAWVSELEDELKKLK